MDGRGLLRAVLWLAGVVAALTLVPDVRDGLGQLQADHLVERGTVKAQGGDWVGALADYERALAVAPRFVDAYGARAKAHVALGENQAAVDDLTTALNIDPKYREGYLARGAARIALGDDQGAVDDFTAALELQKDAATYARRGTARALTGDEQGALDDYGEALKRRDDPDVYVQRGNLYAAQGDYIAASEDYDRALRVHPTDAAARYNRGVARQAAGDPSGAAADLQVATQAYLFQGDTAGSERARAALAAAAP
ncbi:MAG TPA: tetratricopeptide repeat protein [Chloroflexota bacterium]|jgi:tetratricopeptide (TPR) repeat protein